jgi:hypothetical protein
MEPQRCVHALARKRGPIASDADEAESVRALLESAAKAKPSVFMGPLSSQTKCNTC